MKLGRISVVIPAHNEGENLVDTVGCVLENAGCDGLEVIVVDDGSTDDSTNRLDKGGARDARVIVVRDANLGVARARNLGVQAATGDMLVFLDGHCYTPPGWLSALCAPLADPQVGIVGPALADLLKGNGPCGYGAIWRDAGLEMQWLPQRNEQPYSVPLLPGGCHAIRRDFFEESGGYDEGMTRWGSEDHEFCLRAWLMGYQVVIQPAAVVHHLFRKRHPYAVETAKVIHNRLRLALLHFRRERIVQVMAYYQGWAGFAESVTALLESPVMAQRQAFQARQCRDDDWFFTRFGSPFP